MPARVLADTQFRKLRVATAAPAKNLTVQLKNKFPVLQET
jgi:hypothetical protein